MALQHVPGIVKILGSDQDAEGNVTAIIMERLPLLTPTEYVRKVLLLTQSTLWFFLCHLYCSALCLNCRCGRAGGHLRVCLLKLL
jgi:hypothetical protein